MNFGPRRALEQRNIYDPATDISYLVYAEKGSPRLPGQWDGFHKRLEIPGELAAAREAFDAALAATRPGKSVECPLCGHEHRTYRRKLNSGMASTAVKLYRLGNGPAADWVNVTKIFPNTTHRGGEWAQLRHWGIALPRERRSGGANSPGDWRLTPLGVAFVEGRLEVPRYVETRGGVLLGKSSETTTIVAALGNAFDYAELLRGEG